MIVAVIAGFVVFIVPTYQDIGALRAQAADYNTILDNAKALQQQRNKLVAKYNAFDPNSLAKLGTMLPQNPENVQLILELNAAASQYGMVLQNVKIDTPDTSTPAAGAARPGGAGQSPDLGSLTITFSVSGPYNGFTNFIKTVEKSLRIIDIKKVTFTALDDKTQNYQYTVAVKTYWLK
ncbi:MAG: hypothetical protein JWM20_786 [Patescibacteria group bacterium]|nr:hypothetical protein [Patescibacteria group bacterium]